MAAKTELSEQDFERILSGYDLGEYKRSKPFAHGGAQTTILIVTSKDRIVLRYYENRSEKHVLFEVRLLQHLEKKGFPVPAAIANTSGKLLGKHKGKPFLLIEFVEGSHPKNPNSSSDDKQLCNVVRSVARLHNLTKDYSAAYLRDRKGYSPEYCLRKYQGSASGKRWLSEELAKLELPGSLPKGICHADLNHSNVLLNEGRVACMLDFDMSFRTVLIYDIASLIYWWAWPPKKGLKAKKARLIVEEYLRWRRLSRSERLHIYDALKLIILLGISWSEEGDFEQERAKIEFLNGLGRKEFQALLFGRV